MGPALLKMLMVVLLVCALLPFAISAPPLDDPNTVLIPASALTALDDGLTFQAFNKYASREHFVCVYISVNQNAFPDKNWFDCFSFFYLLFL